MSSNNIRPPGYECIECHRKNGEDKVKFYGYSTRCNSCIAKNKVKDRSTVPPPEKCTTPGCPSKGPDAFTWKGGRYDKTCKLCRKPTAVQRRNKRTSTLPEKNQCKECKIVKPISDFSLTNQGFPRSECKACRTRDHYQKALKLNKEDPSRAIPDPNIPYPEKCLSCNRSFTENEDIVPVWRYHDVITPQYRSLCTKCHRKGRREYNRSVLVEKAEVGESITTPYSLTEDQRRKYNECRGDRLETIFQHFKI